ncbi:MAG: tRNA lysidine(34) synthetase TilS, partial [Acidobacteria bacterium]|nr:tRNA lysidine(34) synthetase TilS [Acidobacteriota bacterium]
MRDRILSYIRKHGLIQAGDRVGVAVSGGADSIALLRILLELRGELGIVLSVVHFNHKIRTEAEADERFVSALAKEHGLEFHRAEGDAPSYAREHKVSLETAARRLRYEHFRALVGPALDKIATAHTVNDQAETVLMRVLRGTGTKGLAAIYPMQRFSRDGESPVRGVVRPMLSIERDEIEAWLREIGQPWRDDATNLDLRHLRNRVRHQLLPVLKREFNPKISQVLSDLAEVARAEEEYFAGVIGVSRALEMKGVPRLQLLAFRTLPLAVQRRLLRHCGETVGVALEFEHVEQVLRLAESHEGSGECELPGGWVAVRERREIRFERREETQPLSTGYEYRLAVPGQMLVKEIGSLIKAFVRAMDGEKSVYNQTQLIDP